MSASSPTMLPKLQALIQGTMGHASVRVQLRRIRASRIPTLWQVQSPLPNAWEELGRTWARMGDPEPFTVLGEVMGLGTATPCTGLLFEWVHRALIQARREAVAQDNAVLLAHLRTAPLAMTPAVARTALRFEAPEDAHLLREAALADRPSTLTHLQATLSPDLQQQAWNDTVKDRGLLWELNRHPKPLAVRLAALKRLASPELPTLEEGFLGALFHDLVGHRSPAAPPRISVADGLALIRPDVPADRALAHLGGLAKGRLAGHPEFFQVLDAFLVEADPATRYTGLRQYGADRLPQTLACLLQPAGVTVPRAATRRRRSA